MLSIPALAIVHNMRQGNRFWRQLEKPEICWKRHRTSPISTGSATVTTAI
jgi:hypothetical protein